jgi:outer membrane protein assembly factor BamD (BamD/ComL family)
VTQSPPRTALPAAQAEGGRPRRLPLRVALTRCLASYLLLLAGGCAASWNPFKRSDPPAPPPSGEGIVLTGGKLEPQKAPQAGTPAAELEAAKELFQKGDYKGAEKRFYRVAENKKALPSVAEEARFYEAESQRLQGRYPAAVATYKRQLKDFPSGAHQKEALKQMFDIANYWLDETRDAIKAYHERQEGKRSFFSWPGPLVHFDKTKPFLDLRGNALSTLEQVYLNDPIGPLGEKALWYIGQVRMYEQDWRDADFYFSQIVKNYPNGEFAPKAVELSIVCKQLSTGGPEYDGRKVDEARQLVQTAMHAYPELASQKSDWLHRQLAAITMQQAAKDMNTARFYERTFHPGAAYFCYEIVIRRYPGTKFAEEAEKRKKVLEERARKDLKNSAKTNGDHNGPLGPPSAPLTPGTPLLTPADTPPRLLPFDTSTSGPNNHP